MKSIIFLPFVPTKEVQNVIFNIRDLSGLKSNKLQLFYPFLICLLICTNGFSQVPIIQWQKTMGGSGLDCIFGGTNMIQTNDGGYLFSGYSDSNDGDVIGNTGNATWIVKLNNLGNIQWQKFIEVGSNILQIADGGYIFIRGSNLIKLNNLGAIQWQKNIGQVGYVIKQTADGGYVVGSETNLNIGIIKLNNLGDIQWQKTIGGSNYESSAQIQQTTDGGYIVVCNTQSNSSEPDFWVVKLNNLGDIQWQKTIGGSEQEIMPFIQQTIDGGYIVAGITLSNDGDVSGNHGSEDIWVVKLNNVGNIQWQKTLGGSGGEEVGSIQQVSDGGYLIAGYTGSNDGNVSGNHGNVDCWVVKLNNLGVIQWQKTLGGSNVDFACSVQQTSDGGYIGISGTESNDGDVSGNHGNRDFWIVKLTNDETITAKFSNKYGSDIIPPAISRQITQTWNPSNPPVETDFGNRGKIAVDGEVGTIIELTNSNANRSVELALRTTAITDNTTLGTLTRINSTTYEYRHPTKIGTDSKVKFDIKATVGTTTSVLGTFDLATVPPPLLLVHGLISAGDSWNPLRSYLINNNYLPTAYIKSPDLPNTSPIDPTYTLVGNHIQSLLESYRTGGISVNQVDIIGHSMGGLLSRFYLQNFGNSHFINKLITLNTPHSGSQVANSVSNSINNVSAISQISPVLWLYRPIFRSIEIGALLDLRVNSTAIQRLNGIDLNRYKVPSHSITSQWDNCIPYSTVPSLSLHQLLNEQIRIESFSNFKENRPVSTICTKLNSLLDLYHDGVVAFMSQKGGISSNATRHFSNFHAGSNGNAQIQDHILNLLNASTENPLFSMSGFNPVTLTPLNLRSNEVQLRGALPDITINNVRNGDSLIIGRQNPISISGNTSVAGIMAFYYMDYDTTILKNDTLIVDSVFLQSNTFNLFVPNDFKGSIKIGVLGTDGRGAYDFDTLSVYVKQPSIVVPVELMTFSGKAAKETNILAWQTASEKNCKGFNIQRSSDSKTWEDIGFVEGNGNSTIVQNYNWIDEHPLSISYYQLRQIDFDGKESYSKIVSLVRDEDEKIDLYPNPTNGKMFIKTTKFQQSISKYSII